jgi:hypothetical protein
MKPVEVQITVAGPEIAKWAAQNAPQLTHGGPALAHGMFVIGSRAATYVDLKARDVAYLDPDTSVTFAVFDDALPGDTDWGSQPAIATAALKMLFTALGEVTTTGLRIEITQH